MFYSNFLTIALASFLSFHNALAAPLETRIGDVGSQDNKKLIEDTMPIVNQRIKNMQAVVNLPEDEAKKHPAIIKAFGENANIAEIKKTVDTLETAKITIPHTDPAPGITQGGTNEATGHVVFGQPFYSSDPETRAGTIIHEATHAKAATVDAFDKDGKPYDKMADIPKDKVATGVQIGYKDSHLDQLKENHSDQMHRNADSFRVLSEECPHVRRSLYRRAMAEPHPVIRSELLRRAATSCASKPKPKPENKVTDSQPSTPIKKPTDTTGNKALPGARFSKDSGSGLSTKQHNSNGPAAKNDIKSKSTPATQKPKSNSLRTTGKSNAKANSGVHKSGVPSKNLKPSKGTRNGPSAKAGVGKPALAKKPGKVGLSSPKLQPRPNSAPVKKGAKSNAASKAPAKSRSASRKPTSQKSLKTKPASKNLVKTNGSRNKAQKPTKLNGAGKKLAKPSRPNSASRKAPKFNAGSKKLSKPRGGKKSSIKPTARKPTTRPGGKKSSRSSPKAPSRKSGPGKSKSTKPVSKKSAPRSKAPSKKPAAQKMSKKPAAQKPASKSRYPVPPRKPASKPAPKSTKGRK